MSLEFDLDWQEPGWRRMIAGLSRGTEIPVERFFAMLGAVDGDEAMEAALALEEQGVGLDVSRLPQARGGAAAERLAREAELARRGALPDGLPERDPLALYYREVNRLPRLDGDGLRAAVARQEDPNRMTEGLLYLVLREAEGFAGHGVLLMDLIQEGSLGLLRAAETPEEANPMESILWHVRQAMARAVALQYLASGESQRLVAAMRAYQQADRRLLERLGRNPGPEELAQELGKPVDEVLSLGKMVRQAAASARTAPETPEEKVEDSAYFQLRTRVEELLSCLPEADRELMSLRFGLGGGKPMTLAQAAEKLGLEEAEAAGREAAAMGLMRQADKGKFAEE